MPEDTATPWLNDALPLSPTSLLALLGGEFRQARGLGATPVALRSRNRLFRLELAGAAQPSLIVKIVREEDDPYWQHHLRREHWVLELLQRFWPDGAPRPYAAAFGRGWGLLIMQDVGAVSLAEALDSAATEGADLAAGSGGSSRQPAPALLATLERLAELHEMLRRQQRIFYRVCQSIELDRITAASLLSRLQVARRRLRLAEGGAGAPGPLPPALLKTYRERVILPLLSSPRQMVHNSLSPLNVVLATVPRIVDWETMAYAAPEFDLVDLLRYPTVGLSWPDVEALVRTYLGAALAGERLRLAALGRAIDYAGANAQQAAASHADADSTHAALAGARCTWYLQEARTLAGELGLAAVLQGITG